MNERLLDKANKPTKEMLENYCGIWQSSFQDLNNYLENNYQTATEIRFHMD